MAYWVKLRPGCRHKGIHEPGDVIEVTEAEMQAFGDKFEELPEPDATGAARSLADEHDISLHRVEGSGLDGRIVTSDVEAVINGDS